MLHQLTTYPEFSHFLAILLFNALYIICLGIISVASRGLTKKVEFNLLLTTKKSCKLFGI